MTSQPLQILERYWGYQQFRPMQEEIITSILEGNDTLAVLPTGGGKSICYQVPAMMKAGLCLVVSPLIALMKDQVDALRRKQITAFAIHTGLSRKEVISILQTAGNSNCKFLYVSPERLETDLFKTYLPSLQIELIAIDEAHCISQWGYDFRPAYLKIAGLRSELPHVPILAVTASATPEVQQDICKQLLFEKPSIFKGSFERSNLSFSVLKTEAKMNKILELLQQVPGSGIVYCRSRRKTQEVANQLALHGISADYYHAGLTMEQRTEKQNAWLKGATSVMVCTNAFGMGIDKADVRCVIHHDVPDCLENYYQEAGRAGRDGEKSYATLLYDEQDLTALESLPATRFPPPDEIKKVYRCLVNHLQIPSGSGKGEWHPFQIKDFTKAFGLPMDTAVYSIKLLEQEGWLMFAGQIFLPSRLVFTCSREALRNAEEAMPKLDPLIKGLLRSYGGILDMETTISEYQLANFIQQKVEQVRKGLERLHQLGMVDYQPQTDAPQIQFLYDRPPAAELQLSPLREMLKKQFEKRLNAMIDYVNEKAACRAGIIATYFGDANAGRCKVCDNCLKANTKPPTAAEIEKVYQYLIKKMNGQGLSLKALTEKLSSERKAKLMTMIEYLLAEEKLSVSETGMLFQKDK